MALSKDFFLCGWNIFDLIIVSASVVDIIFELLDGLSVLRGLRLVNMFTNPSITHNMFILHFIDWKWIGFLFFVVESFEIGSVVDNNESAVEYYYFNDWRAGKSYVNLSHSYLYICRYWNATVFKRLHARKILSRSSTTVWFFAMLTQITALLLRNLHQI